MPTHIAQNVTEIGWLENELKGLRWTCKKHLLCQKLTMLKHTTRACTHTQKQTRVRARTYIRT